MSTQTLAVESPSYEGTGVPNGKLGVWLFLASEVMLFGTLFTTYLVVRTAAVSWPLGWKVLNVPLGTLNTFILIASSVTIVLAHARAAARDRKGFMTFMGITVALALCFLVVKGFEWHHEFAEGIRPSSSIFYAVYFTTTGLHALHVICGILWNVGLMWWASRDGFDDSLFVGRVEYAGLYWHFVDIVWIFLFPALYLM